VATTTRRGVANTRVSAAVTDDVAMQWRLRCALLEEKLEDLTRALGASEEQRRELSLDYRFTLDKLWKLNARMPTRRER
jgi:hypothetical protein